jgi:hypothetical protein
MGRKKLIIIITIGIVAFAGAVGTLIALNKFGIITKKTPELQQDAVQIDPAVKAKSLTDEAQKASLDKDYDKAAKLYEEAASQYKQAGNQEAAAESAANAETSKRSVSTDQKTIPKDEQIQSLPKSE